MATIVTKSKAVPTVKIYQIIYLTEVNGKKESHKTNSRNKDVALTLCKHFRNCAVGCYHIEMNTEIWEKGKDGEPAAFVIATDEVSWDLDETTKKWNRTVY